MTYVAGTGLYSLRKTKDGSISARAITRPDAASVKSPAGGRGARISTQPAPADAPAFPSFFQGTDVAV